MTPCISSEAIRARCVLLGEKPKVQRPALKVKKWKDHAMFSQAKLELGWSRDSFVCCARAILLAAVAFSVPFSSSFWLLAQSQSNQKSINGLASQAREFEARGRLGEAAELYKKILGIDPRSVPALNQLGALYVRQKKFSEGLDYYHQALKINPLEFGTNLNLGIAYIKMQNYRSATSPLTEAIRLKPSDLQARKLLAVAFLGDDNYRQAIPDLEKVRELDPNDLGSTYLLIRAYLETKELDKAFSAFKDLEALDPKSPWLHILKGQAYDGTGAYTQAIAEFQEARNQLPNDATVHFSLGFMYWKLHRYAEAEPELEEALRLDRRFNEAAFYLADSYLGAKEPVKALPLLQDLVKEEPENYRVHLGLGKALEQLGHNEEAVSEFQRAIQLGPTQAGPHYLLGRTYQKLKRMAEFKTQMEIAQKLQAEKRTEAESLLKAAGIRGDPTRSLGVLPPSGKAAEGPEP